MAASLDDPRVPERLRSRILVDPVTGCWLWQGGDSGSGRGGGYGTTSWCGVTVKVHLLIWSLLGGRRLRKGEQLDHECVTRRCCCPDHLKPRTQSVNIRLANKRRRAAA